MTLTKDEITPHDPQFDNIKRHDLESYQTLTHIGEQESSFTHTMPVTGLYAWCLVIQDSRWWFHLYFNDKETEAHLALPRSLRRQTSKHTWEGLSRLGWVRRPTLNGGGTTAQMGTGLYKKQKELNISKHLSLLSSCRRNMTSYLQPLPLCPPGHDGLCFQKEMKLSFLESLLLGILFLFGGYFIPVMKQVTNTSNNKLEDPPVGFKPKSCNKISTAPTTVI